MACTVWDCRALVRVEGSGITCQLIVAASAGIGPVYSSWRSNSTIFEEAELSVIRHGPEPTGFESKASGSSSTAALGTIFTVDSRSANTPVGCLRVEVTVVSSFFSTESMQGMNCEDSEALTAAG